MRAKRKRKDSEEEADFLPEVSTTFLSLYYYTSGPELVIILSYELDYILHTDKFL